MADYPPEDHYGNIEYKRSLVDKSDNRIACIATQMRMRLHEGHGEAIYVIGVDDDGSIVGVNDDEFTESFNNLTIAADTNTYSMTILTSKDVPKTKKKVYEILVRENNEQKYIDIKVAVAGNVDSGKSSLLGVLTSGQNDDGRGKARLSIFNFKHEVSTGRTSSIAHHILGFDDKGQVMNYSGTNIHKKGWPEIVKDSSKIISFFDLCGHEKYLRTTILGLTSSFPDLCLILVGANMGLSRMTQEHIFLCVTLKIPFAIVLTKIDICANRQNILKETINNINRLMKMPGLRRIPYKITNMDDVIICAKNVKTESVVPIFHVSNVTGMGINFLKQFLNLLGKSPSNIKDDTNDVEMHLDTTFTVPGVGTVVGGQLISGIIKVNDKLMLGPNEGKFVEVQVRSIHCKRTPLQEVVYGSYVCLGLKKIDRKTIRRGNVIISKDSTQIAVNEFDADITVLKSHSTTVKPGYEPVIHTCTMRQSAKIISITNKINARDTKNDDNDYILRTGDKAIVRFRFSYRPEYIKSGSRLLLSDGHVKIIGVVK
jgi:GTPase